MTKYIQRLLIGISLLSITLIPLFGGSQFVYADDLINNADNAACSGVGLGNNDCSNTAQTDNSINTTLKAVVDILSIIVGMAAVFVIIIQGLRFILSGGDSSTTVSARNGILYAVVGLIIVAIAQVIVHFVIGKATNQ